MKNEGDKDHNRKRSKGAKRQLAAQYNPGKPRSEIIRKYNLTGSAFDRWVKRLNGAESTHEKENRTPEVQERLRLRKENQQLINGK